ncbi:MAG: ATP-binding protein [Chloroflexia bacterium]|nr:ATP-binding protein [Chloroflexia bacterium]
MSAHVVIVNGLPGVGKTTQARALATGLGWPLMTKDMFKESLFDSLGWSDRAWSRKLSKASMDLLFVWLESELQAGRDCVIEANFEAERDTPRFVALAARYAAQWVQVLVVCDGDTLWQRHINRGNDGSRHPGHQEAAVALELRDRLLTGRVDPLLLEAPCIELDTTDLTNIDMVTVLQQVRSCWS